MKVSLNTVKKYINFDLPPVDELKKRINEQLGGIEEIIDLSAKYKGIVIVKIMSAKKHPDADKLTVCRVDDGGVVQNVSRDENGYVQVVCGAPNAREGIFAVWLPPAVTVPASFADAEPFVLSAREIRGVVSNGMLAAADELAIGSGHNGIIELTDDDMNGVELKPGLDFAETFGLNDTIIDIENKMFTHRPDCFGQLGVAREIAGILGYAFTSPEWYLGTSHEPRAASQGGELALTVNNDAMEKVPRFMAVAIKDVTIQPSPFWLQAKLVALGSKPINNIVDITNYVMLITAQPLHAYDYDKLRQSHESRATSHEKIIGVRMARGGESVTLLNGKTYQLTPDDIVIVDGQGPIGMGGIMGGGNSEVSAETKNIVLECATFDMYAIRKTSMRHGLFTDAVTRFNKGQSPLQNAVVMAKAIEFMEQFAGGTQASDVYDIASHESRATSHEITIAPDFINERLGLQLNVEKMSELLSNVEFKALASRDSYLVTLTPPFWRTDIELSEDVVEEVGRLYGFDKLPRTLPKRNIKPVAKNQKREVANVIRESLSKAGANEVLTYSFVHKNVIERAGQGASQAFRLGNALSPELQYYRLSVLPSLLDKVHGNIKAGYDEFVLFEIGKGHNKKDHANDDAGLPSEQEYVDAVYASKKPKGGAPYYHMRRLVTQLANDLGFTLKFEPVAAMDYPPTAPFDLTRSATITSRKGEFIGIVGELKQSVLKNFKLPDYTAAMSLDVKGLVNAHTAAGANYAPLSRFPGVTQDISLKVATNVSYEAVFWAAYKAITAAAGEGYDVMFTPLDIYQGDDKDAKTVTLRVKVTNYDKTLTDADVAPLLDAASNAAKEQLAAERI